ncbi:hypothetical protein [Roseobacter sp. HKCCA0434]|uniref:hypothetical protein n=1 Tax=Roseobacter sp. HKCCA0434 TaxID=3079297 RepID=UPI0029059D8D|nr:hypothetical protein [Roseobacter sp. HKCCA0434]
MRILIATAIAATALGGAATAQPDHCPPGHAMKGWCELGEGRVGNRDHDRYDDHDGERDVVILQNLEDYRLPPLPAGERYAVVDDRIVRVSSDTYATIAVVGALSDLLR